MSEHPRAALWSRLKFWYVLGLVAFAIATGVVGAVAAVWPVFFPPRSGLRAALRLRTTGTGDHVALRGPRAGGGQGGSRVLRRAARRA